MAHMTSITPMSESQLLIGDSVELNSEPPNEDVLHLCIVESANPLVLVEVGHGQ